MNVGKKFCCAFIYGHNDRKDRKDRKDLWNILVDLAAHAKGAWVVLGDFNAIMGLDERIGQPVSTSGKKII